MLYPMSPLPRSPYHTQCHCAIPKDPVLPSVSLCHPQSPRHTQCPCAVPKVPIPYTMSPRCSITVPSSASPSPVPPHHLQCSDCCPQCPHPKVCTPYPVSLCHTLHLHLPGAHGQRMPAMSLEVPSIQQWDSGSLPGAFSDLSLRWGLTAAYLCFTQPRNTAPLVQEHHLTGCDCIPCRDGCCAAPWGRSNIHRMENSHRHPSIQD